MADMVDTLKGLGRVKLAVMTTVAAVLIGFFVFLTLQVSSPGMAPLFNAVSMEDSARIVSELEKSGVPYELRANGTQILVPSDRLLRLRLSMAELGLPASGALVGYEIFDKSETFGSSNFVMNVNMVRALEGELARTIGSFSQVDSARVHLVMPRRELFNRDRQEPTASVAIKLRGGELSKSEIASITHLVAAAVPGLKPSRITVVDSQGRLLAKGGNENSTDLAISNAQEYRMAYEQRMQSTIEQLLEKVVGPGKVNVQVTADIDFDRIVINSEKYDPEGQVARSTQSTSEKESAKDSEGKEDTSVANQLPDKSGSGGGTSSNRQTEKSDETTNFEISKTVENHVKETGTINRISVAVLVDGTYTTDEEDKQIYAPRSETDLKQLESLVKSAIGYDDKRGDAVQVVNMQFTSITEIETQQSFFDKFKQEMEGILQTLIIAGVAILTILLVLRPAIMHLITISAAPSEKTEEQLAALGGPGATLRLPGAVGGGVPGAAGGALGTAGEPVEEEGLIDMANVKGGVKSSSVKKMNEIIDKHPEEAINVIRQWILREA